MKSRYYRNLFYKTLFFFAVWLVLSEAFDRFHMALGIASALAIAWLNTDRTATRLSISPIKVVWYLPWLIVQVVKSGVHLSALILHPSLPIAPKFFRYRTDLNDEGAIVLLANSITLTPGTITLEVNDHELVVHAIDDIAATDILNHRFDEKIAGMVREQGSLR